MKAKVIAGGIRLLISLVIGVKNLTVAIDSAEQAYRQVRSAPSCTAAHDCARLLTPAAGLPDQP